MRDAALLFAALLAGFAALLFASAELFAIIAFALASGDMLSKASEPKYDCVS